MDGVEYVQVDDEIEAFATTQARALAICEAVAGHEKRQGAKLVSLRRGADAQDRVQPTEFGVMNKRFYETDMNSDDLYAIIRIRFDSAEDAEYFLNSPST